MDYTKKILKASRISDPIEGLTVKENKTALKRLRKTLKELEFLRRMGGVTIIVEGDSIITTYHNKSMNRKINLNIKKVKY